MALTPEARDLLIRTLIGEAGNQGPQGMQAVANVIRNRAESGAWKGLTDTIRAHKQFSLWNPGNKAGAMASSVDANSPTYQRAARIADGVFSGDLGDITGGATHYFNPSDANPDWGQGPGQMIGAHKFMKLPLTAGNTAGTAVTSPSTVGMGGNGDPDASRQYLASLSAHPDRAGDTANMNPAFASRLASAIKQARDAGLPVTVYSGFREPGQTGTSTQAGRYDAGGNSSHSYGLATDIGGLDGPNGKITQAWAQIAEANGLHNPYGVGNKDEFNHWQLPSKPLEQTPELLASLKAAKATGDFSKVWDAYSMADAAGPGIQGPIMEPGEGVNPNAPAADAQPASAVAPSGASPIPGGGRSQPAATPRPFSVVQQGMTTGTGRNPQMTTALNLDGLFGGGSSAAAPAAAPFSRPPTSAPLPPVRQAAAPTKINTSYGPQQPLGDAWNQKPSGVTSSLASAPMPPERPMTLPSLAGDWPSSKSEDATGSSVTMSSSPPSIAPASLLSGLFGSSTPNDPDKLPDAASPWLTPSGGGVTGLSAMTPGAPSMGFPAMSGNSFQNLLKSLFG